MVSPEEGVAELLGPHQSPGHGVGGSLERVELDARPETNLIVERRTVGSAGIIDALAADILAGDQSGAQVLAQGSFKRLFERLTRFGMPARQRPLVVGDADERDLTFLREAETQDLGSQAPFWAERRGKPGRGQLPPVPGNPLALRLGLLLIHALPHPPDKCTDLVSTTRKSLLPT
jgi:hypothetical protein